MSKSGQSPQRNKKLRAKIVARKLGRQSVKERVKVAKEITKLQQANQSPQQKLIDDINAAFEQVNRSLQSFGSAIQHIDARQGAIMLVLDDLALRGVADVTLSDDRKAIHWEAYIKHYIDNVRKDLALRAEVAKSQEQSGMGPIKSPLVTPEVAAEEPTHIDVEFGGESNVETGT